MRRALVLLACSLLAACGGTTEESGLRKVRIVTQPYLALAPIHIAAAEGLFEKHGLDAELVQMSRSGDALPLLISGEVDVVSATPQGGFFNAAARGEPIRAVAERGYYDPMSPCSHLGLVARPGLDSAQYAAARRLSYDRQASMVYIVERMLSRLGLSIAAMQGSTEVPHAAELDALKEGKLDLALAGEPWLTRIADAQAGTIAVRAEHTAPNEVFAYVFFGKRLLQDRETGRRFMRAYREAIRLYLQGKTERNVAIVAEATGESPDFVRSACWVSVRSDSRIDTAGLLAFQRWAQQRGLVTTPAALEQLWDSTFVAYADSMARTDNR